MARIHTETILIFDESETTTFREAADTKAITDAVKHLTAQLHAAAKDIGALSKGTPNNSSLAKGAEAITLIRSQLDRLPESAERSGVVENMELAATIIEEAQSLAEAQSLPANQ